jgi:redox-sensitive bicupin YhaK (pirin superfamily)
LHRQQGVFLRPNYWYSTGMETTFHSSQSRGLTSTPWLVSRHSFSFNEWYDPSRVQFGALRVLNDDLVLPGQGFPPHSHTNMEIVTIPLYGSVAHQDSTGGKGEVGVGEVQIMSAGTGVTHSEFNASKTEKLELLQIWVLPKQAGLMPRYEEKKFDIAARRGLWQVLVSPDEEAGSLRIFQQAWFSVIDLDASQKVAYTLHGPTNGAYIFVVSGGASVSGIPLVRRDGLGLKNTWAFEVEANVAASLLVIEVPL